MKDTLKPGIRYQHRFKVPRSKTVPALYPEAGEFAVMPEVLATGFLVGFLVTATVELIAVEGRKLVFQVEAHDGIDLISRGRHERIVVDKERLVARAGSKAVGA